MIVISSNTDPNANIKSNNFNVSFCKRNIVPKSNKWKCL